MEELKQIQKERCFDTKTEPQVAPETSRHKTPTTWQENYENQKLIYSVGF